MADSDLDLDALDCYCDMREPREPCPVGRLKDEVERLRAQRDAVLRIHRRYTRHGDPYCLACKDGGGLSDDWPCDTAVALGAETR